MMVIIDMLFTTKSQSTLLCDFVVPYSLILFSYNTIILDYGQYLAGSSVY